MQMPNRINTNITNNENYRYAYTGKEVDGEVSGNGNSYDFGNRQYDPRLGRWMSLDPLKALYPSMSPYCYAGNTPIAAYDPDGRLILFVNGYTSGCVAGRGYWSEAKKYSQNPEPNQFIDAAMEYFGDSNVDDDVSFINGEGAWYSTASSRQAAGREYVKNNLESIKASLVSGETIKIVTHSMGGAYAEGMIEELIAAGIEVEKVVHLSTADASGIVISENSKDVDRIQVGTTFDKTLENWADGFTHYDGWRIPGVKQYGRVRWTKLLNHDNKWTGTDSHFDTKTYGKTFDWVRDVEQSYETKVGTRNYGDKSRNIYSVGYHSTNGTRFEHLNIGGRFLINIGSYSNGRSDKFKGPEYDTPDNWDHRDGSDGPTIPANRG